MTTLVPEANGTMTTVAVEDLQRGMAVMSFDVLGNPICTPIVNVVRHFGSGRASINMEAKQRSNDIDIDFNLTITGDHQMLVQNEGGGFRIARADELSEG